MGPPGAGKSTLGAELDRQKLAAYPPDVLIDIPRNVANIMDFDRADELIDLGYESAERAMGKHSGGF